MGIQSILTERQQVNTCRLFLFRILTNYTYNTSQYIKANNALLRIKSTFTIINNNRDDTTTPIYIFHSYTYL